VLSEKLRRGDFRNVKCAVSMSFGKFAISSDSAARKLPTTGHNS
jgi:hypothetical protein